MAVEKDQSAWLPEPPPPRPARRDAAISAALRKFDGLDEPTGSSPQKARISWVSTHRPQAAMLVSAMLLVVIGIPAALVSLRNPPATHESEPRQADVNVEPFAPAPPPAAPGAGPTGQSSQARPSQLSSISSPPTIVSAARGRVSAPPSAAEAKTVEEPSPAVAAPVIEPAPAPPAPSLEASPLPSPPPPPPPPAPQALAGAEKATDRAVADNVVVTGSRAPRPGLETPTDAEAVSDEAAYQHFLPKLQAAFERNDRRAIIKLVGLPLRVNFKTGPEVYRDHRSLERDFDRIFTAKVRLAVLGQKPDNLFVRDQGAMVGDGELWFRQACPNSECMPTGSVRIVAVNP